MPTVEIKVPDIGDFHDVPVIEVLVKPGDQVEFMIDKEERIVLAPSAEQEWKKTLRRLAGTMPGLGENFDYKEEREEWDKKATQTRRG